MRVIYSIIYCFISLFASLPAWASETGEYPSLWDRHDSGLQRQLDATLASLDLDKAVKNKKLSVALVDITNLNEPRLAEVNGDRMVYAASLPKIAILLGAFVDIEEGRMVLDSSTRSR